MLQKQQILLQEQTALLQHMHEQQCIASEKLAQQQAMIEALVNENKKIKEQQDMIEMLHTENRRLTRLSKRNSRVLDGDSESQQSTASYVDTATAAEIHRLHVKEKNLVRLVLLKEACISELWNMLQVCLHE
mmetsp:Transcript_63901/g.138994  ORF Transcript_63901/g.138994 Transcript_63901/m.138994 type:complete len:132 (-) Transcript_63901:230-625(-)